MKNLNNYQSWPSSTFWGKKKNSICTLMASSTSNDSAAAVTTLDDLPPNLLLRIISFLPTLDAIQTTLISPAFLNLWTSLPSLSFDFSLFLPPCDTPSETLRAFSDFLTRALLLRHPTSPLRSLHLRLDADTHHLPFRRHVDSWILHAVALHVESLSLTFSSKCLRNFKNGSTTGYYSFPLSLLQNGSVQSLHLEHCNLDVPKNASSVQFDSLACVVLEEVYLTDEMISGLVSRCLNLEALRIWQCDGMKHLELSSPRLKRLDLGLLKCDEVSAEIRAPELSYLRMIFLAALGEYVIEDSSALEEADVWVGNYRCWSKFVRFLSHAKRLRLQNWWRKAMLSKDCLPKSFVFHNLNYLRLCTSYTKADLLGIAVLLECSPKLQMMILEHDFTINEEIYGTSISEEFGRITFNLPMLRHLEVDRYLGTTEELHFLRCVLKSEVVLERIILHPFGFILRQISIVPIVLVKQTQGFRVVQGSFPGSGLQNYQGMDVR